jgi:predicted PurR-regulated permease PerM
VAEPTHHVDISRALTWLGLIFLALVTAALLWFGGKTLLLVFLGILLAVALRAPMDSLKRRTPLSDRAAYAVTLVTLFLVLAGLGLLIGPQIIEQAGQFGERLPQAIDGVRDYLEQRGWGRWLVGQAEAGAGGGAGAGQGAQPPTQGSSMVSGVGGALRAIGVTITDGVFAVVLALFLALDPPLYRRGVVRLIPRRGQQRAGEVVDEMGQTLHAWLMGQLALMLITGVLTGIGLVILGVPLALGLALFVGLMEFIPLIGAIIGFVPILIVAATQGGGTLLGALILYVVVQLLEGNLLVPLVQQRAVSLPPALTIGAVFLGGTLFGPMGAIVGTPLTAALFVLVKMLYVHDALGQTVEVPGRTEPA